MKQKYTRKRLDILYDYKDSIIRFGLVTLFSALMCLTSILVIKDNPYNMSFLPLLSVSLLWFGMFFVLLIESFNKNYLLWLASLLSCVYAATLSQSVLDLILPLVFFSILYEIGMRFFFGAEIKLKLKKYSWCIEDKELGEQNNSEGVKKK